MEMPNFTQCNLSHEGSADTRAVKASKTLRALSKGHTLLNIHACRMAGAVCRGTSLRGKWVAVTDRFPRRLECWEENIPTWGLSLTCCRPPWSWEGPNSVGQTVTKSKGFHMSSENWFKTSLGLGEQFWYAFHISYVEKRTLWWEK